MNHLQLTDRQKERIKASHINVQLCTNRLNSAKRSHDDLLADVADAHNLNLEDIAEFDIDSGKIVLKERDEAEK